MESSADLEHAVNNWQPRSSETSFNKYIIFANSGDRDTSLYPNANEFVVNFPPLDRVARITLKFACVLRSNNDPCVGVFIDGFRNVIANGALNGAFSVLVPSNLVSNVGSAIGAFVTDGPMDQDLNIPIPCLHQLRIKIVGLDGSLLTMVGDCQFIFHVLTVEKVPVVDEKAIFTQIL